MRYLKPIRVCQLQSYPNLILGLYKLMLLSALCLFYEDLLLARFARQASAAIPIVRCKMFKPLEAFLKKQLSLCDCILGYKNTLYSKNLQKQLTKHFCFFKTDQVLISHNYGFNHKTFNKFLIAIFVTDVIYIYRLEVLFVQSVMIPVVNSIPYL